MKDPAGGAGQATAHDVRSFSPHTSSAMVVPNAMDVPLTRLGMSGQATTGTVSHDLALGSDGNSTMHGVGLVVEKPMVCNDASVPLDVALADVLAQLGQLRGLFPRSPHGDWAEWADWWAWADWADSMVSRLGYLERDLQQHLVPARSVAPDVD